MSTGLGVEGCLSILHRFPLRDDIGHPSLYPLVFNASTLQSIGSMTHVCSFCHAQLWKEEMRTNRGQVVEKHCYKLGRVSLLPLEEPLEILKGLLHENDAKRKLFRKDIRAYDSSLAFVSLGAQIDDGFFGNQGVHNFWVHGSIYHHVGNLLLKDSRLRSKQKPSLLNLSLILYNNEKLMRLQGKL